MQNQPTFFFAVQSACEKEGTSFAYIIICFVKKKADPPYLTQCNLTDTLIGTLHITGGGVHEGY